MGAEPGAGSTIDLPGRRILWATIGKRVELAPIVLSELYGPCALSQVFDGDRIDVGCSERLVRVRLLGIDTPKLLHGEALASIQATRALRKLLRGHEDDIRLAFARPRQPRPDQFGRVLAFVIAGRKNLNVEMVKLGYSRFYWKDGAERLADRFTLAEDQARGTHRGFWCDGHFYTAGPCYPIRWAR